MSVPLAASPGRSGFGPQLSLSYDSGSGNGPFGFGWSLSLPSIIRKTEKGLPRYQDAEESDVFILSGAEDLVPEFKKDAAGNWLLNAGTHVIHDTPRTEDGVTYTVRRYRPRVEGLFARIERWTNVANIHDVHWRSISKDNILTLYGKNNESCIADPEDAGRIFSWLICETRDAIGNAVLYEYKNEDGAGVDLMHVHERNRGDRNDRRRTANRYLKCIRYGNRIPLLDNAGHGTAYQWTDPHRRHPRHPPDAWYYKNNLTLLGNKLVELFPSNLLQPNPGGSPMEWMQCGNSERSLHGRELRQRLPETLDAHASGDYPEAS